MQKVGFRASLLATGFLASLLFASWLRAAPQRPQTVDESVRSVRALSLEEFRDVKKAAERGDARSQLMLGIGYSLGLGVSQDDKKAASWFRKAAEQGLPAAQCLLGYAFREGNGVQNDNTQAVSWFRKAAEQDFPDGMAFLGEAYEKGQGVPQDATEAVRLFRRAAEMGSRIGQKRLADMYMKGFGVEKNPSEAAPWYRKAAEQGDRDAQYILGVMYWEGLGVAWDYVEAEKWLQKAADQGRPKAQQALAEVHILAVQEGPGLKPSTGSIEGGVYRNEFFGFSYSFPAGWHPASEEYLRALRNSKNELSRRRLLGDKPQPANVVIRMTVGFELLVVSKSVGPDGPQLSSPTISIWAEEPMPGVTTARDYLANSFNPANDPRFEVIQPPTPVVFGGREFLRVDYQSRNPGSAFESRVVGFEKNYVFAFEFSAQTREELEELIATLQSLHFGFARDKDDPLAFFIPRLRFEAKPKVTGWPW